MRRTQHHFYAMPDNNLNSIVVRHQRKIKLDTPLPPQKKFCNISKYQGPESQEEKTKERGKLKRHN